MRFTRAAGHCVGPGVGQRHVETVFLVAAVVPDLAIVLEGDCEIVVHRLVIEEVILDDVPLVAETEDEVAEAVLGVDLHDVPEDGPPPDFHHRLRAKLRLLTQTGSDATT